MIELPEALTIAQQINDELKGKNIEYGNRGNSPHKFAFYNRPGGYSRLMDSRTVDQPCPECGAEIEKIQYLGGASYFCPRCQI